MKTREISFNGRVVGVVTCACPSCGSRSLVKIVPCDHDGKRCACKCTSCGMNTGPRKSPRLALKGWNNMADRMMPVCRFEAVTT